MECKGAGSDWTRHAGKVMHNFIALTFNRTSRHLRIELNFYIYFYFFFESRIAIDVLRQTAKACVVKREFNKARILILKAVKMAM